MQSLKTLRALCLRARPIGCDDHPDELCNTVPLLSLIDSDELDSNGQRQSGSAYDAGGGRLWVLRLIVLAVRSKIDTKRL